MSVTEIRNHFVNWREWELNPIVIKELRQAVRSWAVTGMLLLDGRISADGSPAITEGSGGGSGGSVFHSAAYSGR